MATSAVTTYNQNIIIHPPESGQIGVSPISTLLDEQIDTRATINLRRDEANSSFSADRDIKYIVNTTLSLVATTVFSPITGAVNVAYNIYNRNRDLTLDNPRTYIALASVPLSLVAPAANQVVSVSTQTFYLMQRMYNSGQARTLENVIQITANLAHIGALGCGVLYNLNPTTLLITAIIAQGSLEVYRGGARAWEVFRRHSDNQLKAGLVFTAALAQMGLGFMRVTAGIVYLDEMHREVIEDREEVAFLIDEAIKQDQRKQALEALQSKGHYTFDKSRPWEGTVEVHPDRSVTVTRA